MSSQDLVDYYVDKLKSTQGDLRSLLHQAIEDPQLLLYREISDTVDNDRVDDSTQQVLELLTFEEYSVADSQIRRNVVVSLKLRILTVFSVISEMGISVSLDVLMHRLEFRNKVELFSLLLQMVQRKLVEIAIDERADTVVFTGVYFFREVPKNVSVDDVRNELGRMIERMKAVNFSLPEDIVESHKILAAIG